MADDQILVDNGARTLTLDEPGGTLAGMGRHMPDVGARVWWRWNAPEAGDRPLDLTPLTD